MLANGYKGHSNSQKYIIGSKPLATLQHAYIHELIGSTYTLVYESSWWQLFQWWKKQWPV